jgi:hypothetical protein
MIPAINLRFQRTGHCLGITIIIITTNPIISINKFCPNPCLGKERKQKRKN